MIFLDGTSPLAHWRSLERKRLGLVQVTVFGTSLLLVLLMSFYSSDESATSFVSLVIEEKMAQFSEIMAEEEFRNKEFISNLIDTIAHLSDKERTRVVLIGAIRFKQNIAYGKRCKFPHKKYHKETKGKKLCFSRYDKFYTKDIAPFIHPYVRNGTDGSKYHKASEMNSTGHSGRLTRYGGGGYYIDINPFYDFGDAVEPAILKWIVQSSRSILVASVFYNVNSNTYITVDHLFEFNGIGVVYSKLSYCVFPANVASKNYNNKVAIYALMIYSILALVLELYKYRHPPRDELYTSFDHYFHLFIAGLIFSLAILKIILHEKMKSWNTFTELPKYFKETRYVYPSEVYKLCLDTTLIDDVSAWLMFTLIMCLLRNLKLNRDMILFHRVITKSILPLIHFGALLFLVVVIYGICMFAFFRDNEERFRNFGCTMETLIRILFGKSDLEFNNYRTVGPLALMVYITTVTLLSLSLFIAIVMNYYMRQVEEQLKAKK